MWSQQGERQPFFLKFPVLTSLSGGGVETSFSCGKPSFGASGMGDLSGGRGLGFESGFSGIFYGGAVLGRFKFLGEEGTPVAGSSGTTGGGVVPSGAVYWLSGGGGGVRVFRIDE